jgi:pyruvate dehydrogenase E2 component (dihydrolipoamide acetyltransferase)
VPIARQVSRSWSEIPHFAVAREIAADGVTDRLAGETPGGVRVTVTDLLVGALGRSLARYGSSDVGLAVATRHGVQIPVLPDVAGRKLSEIAALRRSAVERARNRRSTEQDGRTPLVTLSNLGTHGVEWFTGIIPLGQRGLLTTGTLAQRPVVRDGRLSVAWRLTAILNVDHRVWDGLEAAELLSDFDDRISAYGRYDDDD